MRYRSLGRTRLHVSEMALGTVALGMSYGFSMPGEPRRLSDAEAKRVLSAAADAGVNLFDTAPSYGESERLLGAALGSRPDCFVATKVPVPRGGDGGPLRGKLASAAVFSSIDQSLRALERDTIEIIQIHNASLDVLADGQLTGCLQNAQQAGKVRFIGASVYTEAEALAVIDSGVFDVLQVPYNLLDQRMAQAVFPAAIRASVGLIVRSAFLKGVLTPRVRRLPPKLAGLQRAADCARGKMEASWSTLPALALRFCLSAHGVASVLVGARTCSELRRALAAAEAGALDERLLSRAPALAVTDGSLTNPALWPSQ